MSGVPIAMWTGLSRNSNWKYRKISFALKWNCVLYWFRRGYPTRNVHLHQILMRHVVMMLPSITIANIAKFTQLLSYNIGTYLPTTNAPLLHLTSPSYLMPPPWLFDPHQPTVETSTANDVVANQCRCITLPRLVQRMWPEELSPTQTDEMWWMQIDRILLQNMPKERLEDT